MPCTGCSDPDYEGTIKARYIGKKGDKSSYSHETGRVYTLPARYANKKAYPLFELVAIMPGTVIPEKYRYIEKRVEVPVELVPAPVEEKVVELDEDAAIVLTQSDRIAGMDINKLKIYIRGMGGKVDNRWGLEKLIEEAQKLQ